MKFKSFLWKEILHLKRDPKSLFLIMILPLVMLLLYGYVIRLDVKNIKVAVVDFENSSLSRSMFSALNASKYFIVETRLPSMKACEKAIVKGKVDACLVVPKGLSKSLFSTQNKKVLLVVDGSDPNLANNVVNYFYSFLQHFNLQLARLRWPFKFSTVFLYNPELKSAHFFVPGLAAILLMMICAMLTSITIVREREYGSLKLLKLAPVSPFQIILVKVIPYTLLAIIESVFILTVATLWFSVPMKGSPYVLALTIVVYVLAGLSFGIFLSTIASSQATAMILSLVLTILPSVLLSGFIFPIKSMPPLLQALTYIIPARYFLVLIRGIMLMGAELVFLYREILFLLGFAALFLFVSMTRLKKVLA